MTKIKLTPEDVWKEYQRAIDFKGQIDLYDIVETNQNFYNGKQWDGVNAPDLELPVVNILRQAVDYFVSNLVVDDLAVSCDLPEGTDEITKQAIEHITTTGINQVFEDTKFRQLSRYMIKDACLNGDAFLHWWYNTEKSKDGIYSGAIDLELLDNINVCYGNPAERDPQRQPFILIISKLPTNEVKDMVPEKERDQIKADGVDYNVKEAEARSVMDYTTIIIKLYKQDGEIWFTKTTQRVVISKPINLRQKLYPIALMSWRTVKNSYHGVSPITEVIPNQIMINKYYMMLNEFVKKMSFPKILFDQTKIPQWTNKVEAIGVNGDPREVMSVSTPTASLDQQIIQYIENLIEKTKTTLGMYDVVLGDVRPDNTSAIIALQKTASQPLELQKLDYYQAIEDSVRIIVDVMHAFYGEREVPFQTEMGNGVMPFDYASIGFDDFGMNVEIGASAYWSEITQMQSLDNMFIQKIIPDAITYLEQMPDGIVKNKQDIIDANIRFNQQQMMMQDQQLAMQMAQGGQPV